MDLTAHDLKLFNFRFSFASVLWFLLACLGAFLKIHLGPGSIGNFLVYRKVFWHAIHQMDLYTYYPSENLGSYLYGPVFSILISPFALLPVNAGAFLWSVVNAAFLFFAIRKLPVSYKNQNIILLICLVEMMTAVQNMQINCIIAAMILLSYTYVKEEKDFWAAMFVALGFMLKLYGIAGFAFILFSRNKMAFALSFLFWAAVFFCLPMLISSPSFVIHSYLDWYHTLVTKNSVNETSVMQNISVMGMLRHLIKTEYLNLVITFVAGFFYLFPLLRFAQLKNKAFQLTYLSLVLIGVVIFSSSAESPTYIIAMSGVALWFVIQNPKNFMVYFLLWFAIIITSLSPTDLFPRNIRINFIQPYSLKALPCFFIWVVIARQLIKKDFKSEEILRIPEHKK